MWKLNGSFLALDVDHEQHVNGDVRIIALWPEDTFSKYRRDRCV